METAHMDRHAPGSNASPLLAPHRAPGRRRRYCRIHAGCRRAPTPGWPSPPPRRLRRQTSGDFAGLVDIGGRKLYLECHGAGSPTVVLVAGGSSSARYWTDDLLHPDAPRTMVLPGGGPVHPRLRLRPPGDHAIIDEDDLPQPQ